MIIGPPSHGSSVVADLESRLDVAEKSLRLLAQDWAKQRAVNEAYLKWIVDSCANQGVQISENDNLQAVVNALREAIKP